MQQKHVLHDAVRNVQLLTWNALLMSCARVFPAGRSQRSLTMLAKHCSSDVRDLCAECQRVVCLRLKLLFLLPPALVNMHGYGFAACVNALGKTRT